MNSLRSGSFDEAGSRVLAAAATGFLEHVRGQGLDAVPILKQVGIDVEDVGVPTRSIGLNNYCAMLEKAASVTGNDNFGLGYGNIFMPDMFGLIGYIAMASPTLGSSLENFIKLFPFHQQGTEACIWRKDDYLILEYRIIDANIVNRRQDAEFTIAAYANIVRNVLGRDWMPHGIHFEHARPGAAREQHRLFDCEIHYGQRTNALVMRTEHLGRRTPGGDLRLLDILSASIRSIAPPPREDLIGSIRAELRGMLSESDCSLAMLSSRLKIPSWTIQRRLSEQGFTFSSLREAVRRELAMTYVRLNHVPLSEVAALVGYSEQSAFSRAFRGWYDVSPRALRKKLLVEL